MGEGGGTRFRPSPYIKPALATAWALTPAKPAWVAIMALVWRFQIVTLKPGPPAPPGWSHWTDRLSGSSRPPCQPGLPAWGRRFPWSSGRGPWRWGRCRPRWPEWGSWPRSPAAGTRLSSRPRKDRPWGRWDWGPSWRGRSPGEIWAPGPWSCPAKSICPWAGIFRQRPARPGAQRRLQTWVRLPGQWPWPGARWTNRECGGSPPGGSWDPGLFGHWPWAGHLGGRFLLLFSQKFGYFIL